MTIEEGEAGVAYTAVATLPDEQAGVACAEQMSLLHLVEIEVAAVGGHHFDDLVGEGYGLG